MLFQILIKVALFGLGVIVGNTLSMLWTPKCAGMCPTCPPVSLPLPCTCPSCPLSDAPVHMLNMTPPARAHKTRDALLTSCEELWDYECALPPRLDSISDKEYALFNSVPNIIDYREEQQLALWRTFMREQYITRSVQRALGRTDGGHRFPDFDRAILYCMIRHMRPARVIEIGAGESSVVVQMAARDAATHVDHVVIEPFWSELVPDGPRVIKQQLQHVDPSLFSSLHADDILFIDSSHVARPFGDVITELCILLPKLPAGVRVHIHDIFLPADYPHSTWGMRPYTEQWLVWLMLWGNADWEVEWASAFMLSRHAREIGKGPNIFRPPFNSASLWIYKKQETRTYTL